MSEKKCPVCGKYTFPESDIYEDCPICDWTDDPYQEAFPDRTGANCLSLNEAREEYKKAEENE